ncbi:hypothetical protein D3C75_1122950 [compost metagenome]
MNTWVVQATGNVIADKRDLAPQRPQHFRGCKHRRPHNRVDHKRGRHANRRRDLWRYHGLHINLAFHQVDLAAHGDIRRQPIHQKVICMHYAIFRPDSAAYGVKVKSITESITEVEL